MDAIAPAAWEDVRESLIKAVNANFRDWFQLEEANEVEDCLTGERVEAGALLSEFATQLRGLPSPPFLLQRLTELAHLTHNVPSQYKRHEGFKYLEAVLKATRVRSSVAAFDPFQAELKAQAAEVRTGTKLEAISWLDGVDVEEAANDSHLSLEPADYF